MHLYCMMRHRTDVSMGVSIDEIASTLYPNEYEEESKYDGYHGRTLQLTRQIISGVNIWDKNKSQVVYAAYVEVEGYGKRWVWYNMQTKDDPNFQKVQERREKKIAGIEALIARIEAARKHMIEKK